MYDRTDGRWLFPGWPRVLGRRPPDGKDVRRVRHRICSNLHCRRPRGGGATGVAWLAGVVHGLFDEGVDLRTADLVVGTSAGSVVGSWLATGVPFEDLEARVLNDTGVLAAEAMSAIDVATLMNVFTAWDELPDATPASLARVGNAAKLAKTVSLARFRELIGARAGRQGRALAWP